MSRWGRAHINFKGHYMSEYDRTGFSSTDRGTMGGSVSESTTPPTTPGALATPPRQSSWPTAIGIIAIVAGAFGTLGGIWGTIAPFLMSSMGEWFGTMAPGQPNTFAMLEGVKYYMAGISFMGMVLAILLLVGGVMLIRRRSAAAKPLVYWAIFKILYSIVACAINWFVQQEQFAQMQQNMPQQGMPQYFTTVFLDVTVVISLLWLWALPVFILIWFSRRKVKSEVADWDAELVS